MAHRTKTTCLSGWKTGINRLGVIGRVGTIVVCFLSFSFQSLRAESAAKRLEPLDSEKCAIADAPKGAVTAVRNEAGVVVPLTGLSGSRPIGFVTSRDGVGAVDGNGKTLWTQKLGGGRLISGFDLDGDGTTDFALVKSRALQKSCGKSIVNMTWIEFYSGATGKPVIQTHELEDQCHTNLNYASTRWGVNSVLSGSRNGTIALSPQYSSTGWYWRMKRGHIQQDAFLLPSTDAFVRLYGKSDLKVSGRRNRGPDFIAESQPPNGLIVPYRDEDRLVIFTSRRVLDYRIGRLSAAQLVDDQKFHGREDLAGRSYGVVQFDSIGRDRVAVVAGTQANTVLLDMLSGSRTADPWGGIERHVTVYDLARNAVNQRFFGSAHDNNDFGRYEKRLVHPAHIFLAAGEGPSRIGFNEFTNGNWTFHLTKPGSPDDDQRIPGVFVWDIRDLDGKGEMEIIASPTETKASGQDGYFPRWSTRIYRYDRVSGRLVLRQEIAGMIPHLVPAPIEPGTTSSAGFLFPVLTGKENGRLGLYVRAKTGGAKFVPLIEGHCRALGAGASRSIGGDVKKPLARRAGKVQKPKRSPSVSVWNPF